MSSRDRSRSRRSDRSRSRTGRSRSPRFSSTRDRYRRSRSRSAGRRRNLSRRSKSRSIERHYRRNRSSSSSSSSSSDVQVVEPPIRSDDPKYVSCRVFIGRLPPGFTDNDLKDYFKRYGVISDCVVHAKGYGFIQFANRDDAVTAVVQESGSVIKGNNVDVKMAADGRKGGAGNAQGLPEHLRAQVERGGRDRSPIRNRDSYPPPENRDSYPPPPPGLGYRDDPYFQDPYRRPPGAPPVDDRFDRFDDPYRRRDPFDDPYPRDPFYPPPPRRAAPAPAPPPPKIECEIIMLHPKLRDYADRIHKRLKVSKLVCGILSIPADQNLQKQIEDMTRHGVLYAIVVNSQNEVHDSLILNILHGTPQEHRNMPLDDAIKLMTKNFADYLKDKAEKARPPPPPAPLPPSSSGGFGQPSAEISYLLNLLADQRQLTVVEIDKVILYLRDRRDKILGVDPSRPPVEEPVSRSIRAVKSPQSPNLQEQEELKNKIFSILNGGAGAKSPPQQATSRSVSAFGDYSRPPERGNPAGGMINFDSPSVQQALDNLIQTGPNLLKNISPSGNAAPSQSAGHNNGRLTTASPSSPGYGGRPGPAGSGYGAVPMGYSGRPENEMGYGSHPSGSAQMYGGPTGKGAQKYPFYQ